MLITVFCSSRQNEDARYYMDNLNSIDYNRIRTNVDEIFNITDLNDNESRNSSYEIFQVSNIEL